ncbi:hypothetical protein AQUCO_02000605v1 [Aquilegia coerulea]|uniref:Uncharacterized protein n=1 Tax=Aquilegia coerulea TaxID=218851 RepID=A0A2G5DID5_AQUCA|nr:hypothetical protein AQUCO_02000605v1 [Aquilegia coerulea]
MKKSPIFPNSEPALLDPHGLFDPTLHFSQFLEEAKKNRTSEAKTQTLSQLRNQQAQTKMPSHEKNINKSWKSALLFSWLKVDKKHKPPRASSSSVSPHTSYLKPGSLSGPIYGSGRKATPSLQVKRPVSGPISNLFNVRKDQDLSIPYVSLDELNHPTNSQAYGPVYLVT